MEAWSRREKGDTGGQDREKVDGWQSYFSTLKDWLVCWRCGCEWEANIGEYMLEEGQRESYPVCNCPYCDASVAGKVVINF